MLKKIWVLLLLVTGFQAVSHAQATDSIVQFSYQARPEAGGWVLEISGAIRPGWKLYSLSMADDQPNSRILPDSGSAGTWGPVRETGNLQEKPEPLFDNARLKFFENEVRYEIPVSGLGKDQRVGGTIQFMALKGEEIVGPETVTFRFQQEADGKLAYADTRLQETAGAAAVIKRDGIDMDNPAAQCGGTGGERAEHKGAWSIFVLGFLGGLIGLIMPCTFPMIPLTVSFFTKKSHSRQQGVRNAFLYGFFIFAIYVLLSLPFYFLEGGSAGILNNISTNAWLNLVFAAIFLAFALSFFGLFEIALPSSMSNKVDEKSNIGTTGGIFFMALTLAIVSFSCTGPILGTLLVGALNQDGGALQLTVAMAGFGVALGLPFGLFALFPQWLGRLPRSGAWMNTVKIVFAFVELALMLKFLSNADLVMHWGLLKREVFFALWILISLAASLYLFGVLKFTKDPPPARLSKGRIALATAFGLFALYLVPGLTNTPAANRSLVSGFPPPLTYSVYEKESTHFVNDYEGALAASKKTGKPLLIDFTGWACVNCRKMEENVWTRSEVAEMLENDFILVSLYVDDRKPLPESEQFLYTARDGSKVEIKTVGDKYIQFQTENFRNASQPLYAIVSPDEQLLNQPVGYTPDVEEYLNWLKCGQGAGGDGRQAQQ